VSAGTPGQAEVRAAGEAHDRLSDVIRAEMGGCGIDGCQECTVRFSAILESAEEYARAAVAAREPHAAPSDAERTLAVLAAERNQYRTALERIADGSRSRITMMGCANRALAEHPQPEAPHAAPDQVAITRAAAANTIRKLRELIAELLAELATYGEGCLEPDEIANWRKRGGLEES
jgi:hypothetical protein